MRRGRGFKAASIVCSILLAMGCWGSPITAIASENDAQPTAVQTPLNADAPASADASASADAPANSDASATLDAPATSVQSDVIAGGELGADALDEAAGILDGAMDNAGDNNR